MEISLNEGTGGWRFGTIYAIVGEIMMFRVEIMISRYLLPSLLKT